MIYIFLFMVIGALALCRAIVPGHFLFGVMALIAIFLIKCIL